MRRAKPGGGGRLWWLLPLGVALLGTVAAARRGADLEHRMRDLEDRLAARSGELNLTRIHLRRLAAILGHSTDHDIPADLATAIYDIALAEGIDPSLAFSLVAVESRFASRAISTAGAVGLTQVMPSTARWLQPGLGDSDLFERETNLRLGFRYLKRMLEQYDGDLHLALLAYNRGPARVDSIRTRGGDPSNGYPEAVLAESPSR